MNVDISGPLRAAVAVLKELGIYERTDGNRIAKIADIIAAETGAPDMLKALQTMHISVAAAILKGAPR